jgi:uncharacterized protein (TIGR03067 family)
VKVHHPFGTKEYRTMTHTRWRGALALLFALAVLGAGLAAQDNEKPKKPLDGIWKGVTITAAGNRVPDDEAKLLELTIAGDKATAVLRQKSKSGTIKVDASKQPMQFDLLFQGDPPQRGIYRLETDTLTLCFADDGARPTQFESKPGTRTVLMVLRRHKIDVAAIKAQAEKLKLAAAKAQSENNLKQIGLAMHTFHDTYQQLPKNAIYSKDGKPLLSWRVAILPFIEENPLFMEFRQNEPWDSPHNKKLLAKMPKVYEPVLGKPKQPYSTYYQVFTGPGTVFEGEKKLGIRDILDGTSNTILVVEAGEAVPWTKPQDLPFDPKKKELPKVGGLFPDGFHIALCDGSTRWVNGRPDPRVLRAAITRAGGEAINLNCSARGSNGAFERRTAG